MFTGLVETIGTVAALEELDKTASGGGGTSLTISDCEDILGDAHLGDSISVNGTCLTVTEFDKKWFKVGCAPETLRRTNLGSLKQGSKVNLERAVSAATRMGGHFVQGHVDTIATIQSVTPDGNALTFRFKPRDSAVLRYIVEKGYVTIDGASLTVTKVEDGPEGWWEVMLIAYTQEKVIIASKKPGEDVNVEVDQVGKYVEKSVAGYFEDGSKGEFAILEKMVSKLVDERLKALGLEQRLAVEHGQAGRPSCAIWKCWRLSMSSAADFMWLVIFRIEAAFIAR
ncbi:oxidoreductase [Ascochyta rabiei]|uniref:Riboflavin synthase n=1 Tax=Didymella rabiei TaxID=5454 RepID=A0A163KGU9_DIDRA|nr:oxidoreductase [Ascochyta rabiei]